MGLLLPAALGLSTLAIPIIIFYMLRLRRQPRQISSLMLWQRVLQDQAANAPWQRVRRNLLLLLQLLILALLVLALARPFRSVEAKVQGNVILLLDTSASMQASDIAPSRLDAAKNEALEIIRTLKPSDMVTVIAVEAVPHPIIVAEVGLDRNALDTAIQAIEPTNTAANWEMAIALAAASATSQSNTTIVALSDGAIPAKLPALPVPVRWLPVGERADNQAIVALATREGQDGPQLFVQLTNYLDSPREVLIEIRVDGQLFDARNVELDAFPNSSQSLTFTQLPAETAYIEARLNHADDLMLDNAAWTIRQRTGGRILLVSHGNLFLERAFALIPGLSVVQINPDNYPPEENFDLTIFDRVVPEAEMIGQALFIAPGRSSTRFEVQGVFSNTLQVGSPRLDHPVMAFTNFSNLHVAQAQVVEPPPWATILLDSQGGPLIMAGETETERVGIITFDLLKSDLPLQIDFPILMTNFTRWFFDQPLPTNEINRPGLKNRPDNLLDPKESDIRPHQGQIQGSLQTTANNTALQGQQEFWWLLAGAALIFLGWEWFVYWRKGGA